MNDEELEQVFRDGLRRRADEVLVPPGLVPRSGHNRRRTAAVLASVGAVAAVVVVAVGVDAVHLRGHREQGVSDPGRLGRSTQTRVVDTAGWRTEVWHGLQVSVPADWGWGTAPVRGYLCGGPGAVVSAGGSDAMNPDRDAPYVGRPIMLSDACEGGFAEQTPAAPYVWLGADLPAGTVGLGGGYVQQTVEVQGTTLTVATDDASLRQAILDSATAETTCPSLVDEVGLPQAYTVGPGTSGRVVGGQVCVYRRDGALQTAYAGRLTPRQAQAFAGAVASASPLPATADLAIPQQLAVVRVTRESSGSRYVQTTVVGLDGGWVAWRRGDERTLDAAARDALLDVGGLRAVLPVGSAGSATG